MPALGFKPWKADKVSANKSRHTIRPERKRNQIKVGDKLFLFRNFRKKGCTRLTPPGTLYEKRKNGRLIPYVVCKMVLPVRIDITGVYINDLKQNKLRKVMLAISDGFSCYEDFYKFFESQYGIPFKGFLIKW